MGPDDHLNELVGMGDNPMAEEEIIQRQIQEIEKATKRREDMMRQHPNGVPGQPQSQAPFDDAFL